MHNIEKTNDPILRKFSDARTDGRTDKVANVVSVVTMTVDNLSYLSFCENCIAVESSEYL